MSPRELEHMFKNIQEDEKASFSASNFILKMSSIEICNEQIFGSLSTHDDGNGIFSTSTRHDLRNRRNGDVALKLREDENSRAIDHILTNTQFSKVSFLLYLFLILI